MKIGAVLQTRAWNAKFLRLEGASTQIMTKALFTSAWSIFRPAMQAELKKPKPPHGLPTIFEGILFNRITVKVIGQTTKTKKDITVGVGAFHVPYARNIESGSPPHMPNKAKIIRWVRIKFGISGKSAAIVAYRMIKHIRERGTKAYPFVRPVFITHSDKLWADFVARTRANIWRV